MLIAALAIWLIVVFLSVGFCRVAASADSRELALIGRLSLPLRRRASQRRAPFFVQSEPPHSHDRGSGPIPAE